MYWYNTELYNSVLSHTCQSGLQSFGINIAVVLSTEFIADFPNSIGRFNFKTSFFGNAEIALGARNIKIIKNTLGVTNLQK